MNTLTRLKEVLYIFTSKIADIFQNKVIKGSKIRFFKLQLTITINYPIEPEEIYFSDPEEHLEDEDCLFSPVGSKIIIHPGYLYYKASDDSEPSFFIETEIILKDLKPVEEWVFEFKEEENYLEN